MRRRRDTAVAIALFACALAAAGCGLGSGRDVGEVELTVTRDFGVESVAGPVRDDVVESDTVMRVLDRSAEISTRYGGTFVQSINGVAGGRRGGRPYDWFYYVNGLWAPVGAADYSLRGGEAIWWDYRDWSESTRVPALVGSWPQPFADGYEGERHPTAVLCLDVRVACATARRRLRSASAALVSATRDEAIRVLVGSWTQVRGDPVAALIEAGPRQSGVFADLTRRDDRFELWGLDAGAERVRRFGRDAGLVAAMRRGDDPPVWVVTGTSSAGVRAAAARLNTGSLHNRYALAAEGDVETALPVAPSR